MTARAAADLLGIHRNSAALFCHWLRQIIAAALGDPPAMEGEIEVDESYFGGHRKGKRGAHVYTVMLADTRAATLLPIIRSKVVADSIVYTDGYAAYEALDVSEFRHERINHHVAFVAERNPI